MLLLIKIFEFIDKTKRFLHSVLIDQSIFHRIEIRFRKYRLENYENENNCELYSSDVMVLFNEPTGYWMKIEADS